MPLKAVIIGLAVCVSGPAFAQSAATATAAATIVTPGTIERLNDICINIPSSMLRSGARALPMVRKSGRGYVSTRKAEVIPAAFEVSGYPNYTYGLTIPERVTILKGDYLIDLIPRAGTASAFRMLSALGTGVVTIGGTVAVGAAGAGSMCAKSGELAVTIMYN